MILVDYKIRGFIETNAIGLTPYDKTLVNPSSLDVRMGNVFTWVEPTDMAEPIDPTDPSTFRNQSGELTHYILEPRSFVLVSMMEKITLPNFISAKLFGKSSLARLGIMQSPDACWTDPGFSGVLTCELFNCSDYPIKLTPGMKFGQLVFFEHGQVEKSYDQTGRYRDQVAGQGSRGV